MAKTTPARQLTAVAECDAALGPAFEKALAAALRQLARNERGATVLRFGLHLGDLYCWPIAATAARKLAEDIQLARELPLAGAWEERQLWNRDSGFTVDAPRAPFAAIERILARRAALVEEQDELASSPLPARLAGVTEACLAAFERLDQRGAFGSGERRERLLLDPGLEWLDDEAWVAAVRRLNASSLVDVVANDLARRDDLRRAYVTTSPDKRTIDASNRRTCLAFLEHSDWFRRWIGAWHLGLAEHDVATLDGPLRTALDDADGRVRVAAARSLALLGSPGSSETRRVLGRALESGEHSERESAAWALAWNARALHREAPLLVPLLTDPDPALRVAAMVGLMRAAPEPSDAILRAVEHATAMREDDPHGELVAALAIGVGASTEAEPGPFQRRLVEAAGRTEGALTSEAAWMLGQIAPRRPSALRSLLAVMPVQPGAARELKSVGAAAVPGLVQALRSGDAKLEEVAADGLAELGAVAADAVPALIEALASPHWVVRTSAANALRPMRDRAREAIPALRRLTEDEHPAVVKAARTALVWIDRPPTSGN